MSQENVIAQDKVIVIVGVGPGLGTAIPRRFAREGFSVGLIARKAANLEAAKAVIEAEGGKVAGAVGAKVAGAVGAKVAIAEGDASDGVSLKKAFDALRGEAFGEFGQARFVGHGKKCTGDRAQAHDGIGSAGGFARP